MLNLLDRLVLDTPPYVQNVSIVTGYFEDNKKSQACHHNNPHQQTNEGKSLKMTDRLA
jgi:hypothetical protein